MQPRVSVVIPIYNVEEYLEEALESVVNQTLKDIEIILINDGSTDKSLEIAEKYKSKDERIRLINQENSGLSIARNIGIENSNGKYLYFLDSDDYLELETLKKCFSICEKNDLDLIYFDAVPFLDKIKKIFNEEYYSKFGIIKEEKIYTGEEFLYECLKKNKYTTPVWLYFFRKEILEGLRFYPKIYHEDILFTPLLLERVKKMIYIPKKFYKRRYRENSIMTKKVSLENIKGIYIALQELEKNTTLKIEKILKEGYNQIVNLSIINNFENNYYYLETLKNYQKYLTWKTILKVRLKILYRIYIKIREFV